MTLRPSCSPPQVLQRLRDGDARDEAQRRGPAQGGRGDGLRGTSSMTSSRRKGATLSKRAIPGSATCACRRAISDEPGGMHHRMGVRAACAGRSVLLLLLVAGKRSLVVEAGRCRAWWWWRACHEAVQRIDLAAHGCHRGLMLIDSFVEPSQLGILRVRPFVRSELLLLELVHLRQQHLECGGNGAVVHGTDQFFD